MERIEDVPLLRHGSSARVHVETSGATFLLPLPHLPSELTEVIPTQPAQSRATIRACRKIRPLTTTNEASATAASLPVKIFVHRASELLNILPEPHSSNIYAYLTLGLIVGGFALHAKPVAPNLTPCNVSCVRPHPPLYWFRQGIKPYTTPVGYFSLLPQPRTPYDIQDRGLRHSPPSFKSGPYKVYCWCQVCFPHWTPCDAPRSWLHSSSGFI